MFSSLIWTQTMLESDIEHYKEKDLNNWMYLRFKTISKLEPKFIENYRFGGQYLSIVKDDIPGASEIYDLGLRQYPNDYPLLFRAAYHFHIEEKKPYKALPLYERIARKPQAPEMIKATISSIYAKQGKSSKTIIEYLKEELKTTKNAFLRRHLEKKIEKLKSSKNN